MKKYYVSGIISGLVSGPFTDLTEAETERERIQKCYDSGKGGLACPYDRFGIVEV